MDHRRGGRATGGALALSRGIDAKNRHHRRAGLVLHGRLLPSALSEDQRLFRSAGGGGTLQRGLDFPIVGILDTTATEVVSLGARRALVLGTPVTMRSPAYGAAMRVHGVDVIEVPSAAEIEEPEQLIDVQLFRADIARARKRIVELAGAHVKDAQKDAVCLACTELPLAFPEFGEREHFESDGLLVCEYDGGPCGASFGFGS
ncbi:MAG: hypothetical protein GKR94_02345 [Gammaproteobacteria bacterium]|nr:hypothetical protein [Gammaproteobacteria bacterium]